MSDMIIQTPAFNREHFKIGEAVRVVNHTNGKEYDALLLNVSADRIRLKTIAWKSPQCGIAEYDALSVSITLQEVIDGNVTIIRYRDVVGG